MYTKVYRHGRSDRTCLCALCAKIPERSAPIRKSLRSIFRTGPTRAAGVYRSNAAMGF
uniref:Uncharacterized protein n=1 Tax=Microviridae sp. ctfUi1 TaxID=2826740 RepID=A0A8S5R0G4_9VIRU|nr:MAG TPA: hypothetical protein [Microviridae sp. ctfUi1]